MKKFILLSVLCMYLGAVNAQVKSSHDGFYKKDSVFYQLSGRDSFKYCVNCYSADSLHTYTTGVWLYSRESAPNTWENNRFTIGPIDDADETYREVATRPDVVKANTIWVRSYKDGGYTDEHHFVFLGNWKPQTKVVVSVFIDSSDFMGPHGFYGPGLGGIDAFQHKWNYRLKIEKTCSYQIFGGANLQPEAEQNAGVEISASKSSSEFPNKPMQLNANKTTYKEKNLLLGKTLTEALGLNIKILRFRVGGPFERTNILGNEIALDIIRPDMGGEPSTPVCLFINGSFWTYAFAEEGMGRNYILKALKTTNKELSTIKFGRIISATELEKRGFAITAIGHSVYSICDPNNSCGAYYICNNILQAPLDTLDAGYSPTALDELCNAVTTGSDSLLFLTIDKEALYRYALSVWFFQNQEAWAEDRLTMAKAGDKPWELFADHYDFLPNNPLGNDWDKYYTYEGLLHRSRARKSLPWEETKRLLKEDPDDFCRVIEDELNTTYKAERIVAIAQKKIAALRPCINECSKAWWPNGWPDSIAWEIPAGAIPVFLKDRPNGIASALPKIFMMGNDTLLQLQDMHEVSVRFDSLSGEDVSVLLNSLELKSNFSGKYYPSPELRISLKYDTSKYEFVKWLEYPGAKSGFMLSAQKPVTLTPVLRLKKVPH